MIESSIEEARRLLPILREEDESIFAVRDERLEVFPYSIVLKASFEKIDNAEARLTKESGNRGETWEYEFYYKTDYDFGYVEFFFIDEKQLRTFKSNVVAPIKAIAVVEAAKMYLASNRSPIEVIKSLRLDYNIDLMQAKGAYLLASQGISLEDYQEKLFAELIPLFDEMEASDEEWDAKKVDSELNR